MYENLVYDEEGVTEPVGISEMELHVCGTKYIDSKVSDVLSEFGMIMVLQSKKNSYYKNKIKKNTRVLTL